MAVRIIVAIVALLKALQPMTVGFCHLTSWTFSLICITALLWRLTLSPYTRSKTSSPAVLSGDVSSLHASAEECTRVFLEQAA